MTDKIKITQDIIDKTGFLGNLFHQKSVYVKLFKDGPIDEAIVFTMGKEYRIEKRGMAKSEKYIAPVYIERYFNIADGWITIYRSSQLSSGIIISLPERFVDVDMLKEAGFEYKKSRRVFTRVGFRFFEEI